MESNNDNGHTRFVRDPDGRVRRITGSGRGGPNPTPAHPDSPQPEPPPRPAPRAPLFRLTAEQPEWPSITLYRGDRVVIGRNPNNCTVCIESELISRQHAELFIDARGRLRVHDLGSSNGTYVDHAQAPEDERGGDRGLELGPGNRLILGSEDVVYAIGDD